MQYDKQFRNGNAETAPETGDSIVSGEIDRTGRDRKRSGSAEHGAQRFTRSESTIRFSTREQTTKYLLKY